MSEFSVDAYLQESANRAQNGSSFPKVGFFKLAKDGDSCLVRFNIRSTADLKLAKVHKPIFGKKYEGLSNPYAGIGCFNDVTQHTIDTCPLCKAAAEGHPVINKAENVIFVQMLVAYKDQTTGQFSEPVAVVWERKASFARELVAKVQAYGDLTQHLFVMTRMGSGKDTRYSLDYAVPTFYKPEMIPADFSAFNNFQVSKHSYWVKSAEEIETYLRTGSFPEVVKEPAAQTTTAQPAAPVYTQEPAAPTQPTYTQPTYAQPAYSGGYAAPTQSAPVNPTYTETQRSRF